MQLYNALNNNYTAAFNEMQLYNALNNNLELKKKINVLRY